MEWPARLPSVGGGGVLEYMYVHNVGYENVWRLFVAMFDIV